MSLEPLDILTRHPILGLGSKQSLASLAAASRGKRFSKGSAIVTTGTPQQEILVIASGQVALTRKNKEAQTQMLTGVINAPGIFGDAEYYSGCGRWIVTVRAASTAQLVFIPNAAYESFVRSESAVSYAMYRDASARHFLAVAINQVTALQKNANRILRLLAAKNPDGPEKPVDLSIVALSQALGVNRRTVVRNLELLEEQGWLVREGTSVFLKLRDPKVFTIDDLKGGLGASWTLPVSDEE